jgi:hypothetical protein
MKVIVITGGGRRVGKTELAERLGRLLPGSRVVKIGEHPRRADKNPLYFSLETSFPELVRAIGDCDFLILESGKILDDPDCRPDLVVFLPHAEADKPGAERRQKQADLVRGERIDAEAAARLRERLAVDDRTWAAIVGAIAGAAPR